MSIIIQSTGKDGGRTFYIIQLFFANLTQAIGTKEAKYFTNFLPVLITLCMLGLKFLELLYVYHSASLSVRWIIIFFCKMFTLS